MDMNQVMNLTRQMVNHYKAFKDLDDFITHLATLPNLLNELKSQITLLTSEKVSLENEIKTLKEKAEKEKKAIGDRIKSLNEKYTDFESNAKTELQQLQEKHKSDLESETEEFLKYKKLLTDEIHVLQMTIEQCKADLLQLQSSKEKFLKTVKEVEGV